MPGTYRLRRDTQRWNRQTGRGFMTLKAGTVVTPTEAELRAFPDLYEAVERAEPRTETGAEPLTTPDASATAAVPETAGADDIPASEATAVMHAEEASPDESEATHTEDETPSSSKPKRK